MMHRRITSGRGVSSGYAQGWVARIDALAARTPGPVANPESGHLGTVLPAGGAERHVGWSGAPSVGIRQPGAQLFGAGVAAPLGDVGAEATSLVPEDLATVARPRPEPVRVVLPEGLAADSLLGLSWALFQYCHTAREGRLPTMTDLNDAALPAVSVASAGGREVVVELEPLLAQIARAYRSAERGAPASSVSDAVSRTFLETVLQPAFAAWHTLVVEDADAIGPANGAVYLAHDLFGWDVLFPALYGINLRTLEAFLVADTVSEELEQQVGLLQGIAAHIAAQFPQQGRTEQRRFLMDVVGTIAKPLRRVPSCTAEVLCAITQDVVNDQVRQRKQRFYGYAIDQLIGEQRGLRARREELEAQVEQLIAHPFNAAHQQTLRTFAASLVRD